MNKPKLPGHVNLGSIKVNYPSAEWISRADEYVKRVSGRMQEAIDAAAKHGRDDYRVQQASAGAWLAATDLRQMAIERGIELMPAVPIEAEAQKPKTFKDAQFQSLADLANDAVQERAAEAQKAVASEEVGTLRVSGWPTGLEFDFTPDDDMLARLTVGSYRLSVIAVPTSSASTEAVADGSGENKA